MNKKKMKDAVVDYIFNDTLYFCTPSGAGISVTCYDTEMYLAWEDFTEAMDTSLSVKENFARMLKEAYPREAEYGQEERTSCS